MRDIEGLSYDEIAESLQISLGTVKSRIARGREGLKRCITKQ
jgi:RNA polymerase sigma-70 factor (ECF subfamily)